MSTQRKIVLAITLLFVLFALGLTYSWGQSFNKDKFAECKKTSDPRRCLDDIEKREFEERLRSMTPEDRQRLKEEEQRIMAERERIAKEAEELRKNPPQSITPDPNDPQRGKIFEGGDELILMDLKNVFHPINETQIVLAGNVVSIAAGSLKNEPLEGAIVVHLGETSTIERYSAPSKTGPLKIVLVDKNSGIIELVSIAGKWEVYHEDTDTREFVTTPGGARYIFNVRTRKFQ